MNWFKIIKQQLDVKAFNIRWHSPQSKNPNINKPLQNWPTEVMVRIPGNLKNASEEEQRKHIFVMIQKYFNMNIKGFPYDFDFEILDAVLPEGPEWEETQYRLANLRRRSDESEMGPEYDDE